MSKFKKKKKGMPAVNTASLPDIVFMLLFFFMVTTTMRETSLQIEAPRLPSATEIKKLEHKSLVSTIYVGKAKDQKYGTAYRSEEHTSELQSLAYLVCRLLLEKKKKKKKKKKKHETCRSVHTHTKI